MRKMRKIVLIPAYKPDNTLTDLAAELSRNDMDIVVVDDGSGEKYAGVFDCVKQVAAVVTCERSGGKGTALKHGLKYIESHFEKPYIIVTADADGQHHVEDILRVARLAEKNPDALTIGARTISREMPTRNWFGNVYTKLALFCATGKRVGDTQTGLRGFSDRALPFMLRVRGKRYEYEMNVLMWWARSNSRIVEIPILTLYEEGNKNSHFKAVRDSIRIYWEIIKFSAPSFLCFALDVTLFGLLYYLCLPFWAANTLARLPCALIHFFTLKTLITKHKVFTRISAPHYAAVAIAILALNTLLLWGMLALGMYAIWAKVVVDVVMFFATFVLQRKRVYVARG